ncbi:MAG: alkene reductase [Kiritimatiellia bacterium]
MADNLLFTPFNLRGLELKNRIVMAPMTRCRATADHVPTDLIATYYVQRASAGLIITEGVAPSPDGTGYARIPGLYNDEQVRAWAKINRAIHQAGGRVFAQLMHTGRVSHPLNMPAGARILAPSATGMSGSMWTDTRQLQPYPVPAEMTEADIQQAVREFADGSGRAIEAGFDGVELHGANGYLIDQFLNTASNHRTDRWGGSIENRLRFALEVAKAAAAKIGAGRLGIRVSPFGVFNDMKPDGEMDELYRRLATELGKLGLAYIHVVDHSAMGAPPVKPSIKQEIHALFKGTVILSGGYDAATAGADLAAGKGELVAFGRPFISNPDLPRRLREGIPLAEPDGATFYLPGEKGYTDYAVATA